MSKRGSVFRGTAIGLGWGIATAIVAIPSGGEARPATKVASKQAVKARAATSTKSTLRSAGARKQAWSSSKWKGMRAATQAKAVVIAPKPVVLATPAPAMNAGQSVVTIASGGLTSTSARMASDLAAVLDSDTTRVLPLMTPSSLSDALALAKADKVDLAFLHADAMNNRAGAGREANSAPVSYLARLYNEEIHVVAGRDVRDLGDLAGKKVNVGPAGSDNARTAELVFERLRIAPRYVYLDQPTALAQLAAGDLAADILVSGRPVKALQDFAGDGRFTLLPIPYDAALQDLYLPARIEAIDYGNLVPRGTVVETLAVPIVLAAIDAAPGSPRASRIARFTQALFEKFDALRDPTRHPKWREVNLAASVASWTRFAAAQDVIDRSTMRSVTSERPGPAAPSNPVTAR